ncbi:MAG: L-aspartate oxidase [Desulfotalea sp.]
MKSDFLVIGSGIAGLSFALKASELGTVVVVTKKREVDTATNLAQGGVAAVMDVDDSFSEHVSDTLASGDGLCVEEVVKMVVESGPKRIDELINIGVDFKCDESGKLDLGKEGGHSRRRVAHSFDLTGSEIERCLIEAVAQKDNVVVLENHTCVDLLMAENDSGSKDCVGAYVLEGEGEVKPYRANVTVLCTGGAGKVYLYTSNPDIATGDGIAAAFRAGADVSNMEFVQFHPTCLFHHQAKNFLISEAVRGEGAFLVNEKGEKFMAKYEPIMKDLATRDKVARAIDQEMKETGCDCVYLDITQKSRSFLQRRFPAIYGKCMTLGLDISTDPIPVVPAAHYFCGGVNTDRNGATSVAGLYALGETANTGLHGGNRLASNSLLEAVVYSEKLYQYCSSNWKKLSDKKLPEVDDWRAGTAQELDEEILINHNWDTIRRIMWNYVGIVRKENRLKLALKRIKNVRAEIESHYKTYFVTANMVELRNISLIAELVIRFSMKRKESRGLHYILDYPEKKESEKVTNVMSKNDIFS